jgi:Arylsulfotransferase (ASST)
MSKFVKYLVVFWIVFLMLVFAMGLTRHVFLDGKRINGAPKQIVIFLSSLIHNIDMMLFKKPMVIQSSLLLKNGFNRTANYTFNNDYLLVSDWNDSISQCIVELIRIQDGRILYTWKPKIKELDIQFNSVHIFGDENYQTERTTRLLHPILMSDGSLIFGSGCIFKIDRNSSIIWSNKTFCHHSIELDSEGNIWICSYNSSTTNAQKYKIKDDAIQEISAIDGKILFEKSIIDILLENGFNIADIFINPQVSTLFTYLDYFHLNEVQPALEDSKYWKKGDLFLSLRNKNMILLYRPSINKILWSQTGPWQKQHDIEILDSCRIGVFGNNVIDVLVPDEIGRLIDGHNNQYVYNFLTKKCSTPYDKFFKSSNIGTYTEGRSRILPNGDIFVEETNKGRILYGNYSEEIWSYVKRIDRNKISIFNWSRYITKDEFSKFTFINQPVK